MTTNVSADRVPIPAQLSDLTAGWFSQALDCQVSAVEVLDAHSGTTGRARVRLFTAGAVPETLFVKLQPFTQDQRELIRQVGLGVAEARVYANLRSALPVRAPRVWHSAYQPADGAFVMVLEDLTASGCRFPAAGDEDILDVAHSAVEELAKLHAAYRDRELPWLRTVEGMRAKPDDPKVAARRSTFIKCNSLPTDLRRAHQDDLLSLYRRTLELYGRPVDDTTAREQYRLFSVYSWIAATSTAAMGSKWQPIEIARPAMIRATESVEDLDAVGLLEERLGLR